MCWLFILQNIFSLFSLIIAHRFCVDFAASPQRLIVRAVHFTTIGIRTYILFFNKVIWVSYENVVCVCIYKVFCSSYALTSTCEVTWWLMPKVTTRTYISSMSIAKEDFLQMSCLYLLKKIMNMISKDTENNNKEEQIFSRFLIYHQCKLLGLYKCRNFMSCKGELVVII